MVEKSVMKFGKIPYLGNISTKVGKQLSKVLGIGESWMGRERGAGAELNL
jgi:hypothetical protein